MKDLVCVIARQITATLEDCCFDAGRSVWAEEAHAYNVVVSSWPQIQAEAARLSAGGEEQGDLALGTAE